MTKAATGNDKSSTYREKNSTADRALDILGLFTTSRLRLSAVEVSVELGVSRSTAYRYLVTLTSAGYLEEDPHGGFRLGLQVFELARIARASYGLSDVALPLMIELSERVDETVLLTRRSGDRAVCLEKAEPVAHRVRLSYERGSALPLNAGASAQVVLAWEPEEVVHRLVERTHYEPFTKATITTQQALLERLADIRKRGYAVGLGELDADAVGIAAPVRSDSGAVVAGLSLVSVKTRMPPERIEALTREVCATAAAISGLLATVSQ